MIRFYIFYSSFVMRVFIVYFPVVLQLIQGFLYDFSFSKMVVVSPEFWNLSINMEAQMSK